MSLCILVCVCVCVCNPLKEHGYKHSAQSFYTQYISFKTLISFNVTLLKIKLLGKQRGFTIQVKTWKKCCVIIP